MFNNIETAFKDKTDRDLNRAYLLFMAMKRPAISKFLGKIAKIAIYLRLPIKRIVKATVYKHFCGGTSIEKSEKTIKKLWKSNIGTILDFSAEGKESEEEFEKVMYEAIKSIKKGKRDKRIAFAVFKPTGLAKFSLLEKMSSNKELNQKEKEEKNNFKSRVEEICKASKDNNVPVFIDAEESWIQNAIDNIAIDMMKKFNKKEILIFNTLQFYRKDRIDHLKKLLEDARTNNFSIGVKLVRGAYHEKEIARAKQKGYTCPVYIKKEETDKDYDKAIEICIKNIDIISFCAGTHNEESSYKLIELIKNLKIPKDDKRIYFSQLLGMSDHISYNTSSNGFNVAKYIPYGSVKDLLPYLIRRAEENTSISGQMGRELTNIIKERNRRRNNS